MSTDLLPIALGIALVALASVFALLPFVRPPRHAMGAPESSVSSRVGVYRQVLELEFDHQMGKLSTADFEQLSAHLLAQAGEALARERGALGEVDAEIEREIAAARAAFSAARRASEVAQMT
jgi:hypothetical protein